MILNKYTTFMNCIFVVENLFSFLTVQWFFGFLLELLFFFYPFLETFCGFRFIVELLIKTRNFIHV